MPITSIIRSPSTLSAAGPRKGGDAADEDEDEDDEDELLLDDELLLLLLGAAAGAAASSASSSSRARLRRRVSMWKRSKGRETGTEESFLGSSVFERRKRLSEHEKGGVEWCSACAQKRSCIERALSRARAGSARRAGARVVEASMAHYPPSRGAASLLAVALLALAEPNGLARRPQMGWCVVVCVACASPLRMSAHAHARIKQRR